jgi:PAS domain S-box-containing protein
VLVGRLTTGELTSTLADIGVPAQLLTANGLVLSSTRPSDRNGGKLYPDPVSVWNFANSLSPDNHGVMRYGVGSVLVAVANEPGVPGYTGKGWKLIAMQENNVLYGSSFALLGAALFGLLCVLCGLIFFGRIPLRLIGEFKQIAFYTEQQLRGITEFIPNNKEVEVKSVYSAIERLAVRYNVLARTRDDSTIKLAQDLEAYREDRDRYAVMIGAMREGACAINNDGIVTLCNLSAATMLGRNRDEIIGQHYLKVFRLYLDEDMTKEFDALEKALLSGGMFAEEGPYYVQQASGGALPVRMQSTVIRRGADRAAIGIFVLMRDVGKELAVEQAKNEFISVTSHQMRTPLATMRWHIERLLRPGAPPTPEVLRDYLERIERNNKRMIRLAEALLDVSRIDLEVSKSKDVEVDIPDVVKEVLDEIDEETLSKRTIVQNYEGIRGQKTLCDPYLVRVVLENFIENAINYTKPKGKITITVVVDGDSLRIDVNDDGIGIAADMKDKIFSKFVRGKDATAMQPAGTGLGLYITKSLVERAGGKIWFESKRNEGSTFSVRFPLSDPNNN